MSNALAIAAVTTTLRRLIEKGLEAEGAGIAVLTRPPDRASQANGQPNRVNLFLYQTALNGAWRNLDMPRQVRPGETSPPPLPLDLFYLVTAYAENDDEVKSHRYLGRAMSVLHDHPLLGADEIRSALAESDLHEQLERIRITPQPLSIEEISKLWSGFQTQYRLSATYQVSVVLIESTRAPRMALPVLTRGKDDSGVTSLASPFATLSEVRPPRPFPSARLGDEIVIAGEHLSAGDVTARMTSSRLPTPIPREVIAGERPGELRLRLPGPSEAGVAAAWIAGFYTLALVARRPGGPTWTSNEVAFAIAPVISVSATQPAPGEVSMTLTCLPRVREGQRIAVLIGDRQVLDPTVTTPADPAQPTSIALRIKEVPPGKHVIRVRVDGVDSIPLPAVPPSTAPRMEFDPAQTVTVV